MFIQTLCVDFVDYEKALDYIEHFAIFDTLVKIGILNVFLKTILKLNVINFIIKLIKYLNKIIFLLFKFQHLLANYFTNYLIKEESNYHVLLQKSTSVVTSFSAEAPEATHVWTSREATIAYVTPDISTLTTAV